MKKNSAHALLLLAGVIWGVGFVAQKTSMDDVGPLLFVGLRFLIAALVTFPLAWIQYRRLQRLQCEFSRVDWMLMTVTGVVFFLAMTLQQVGLLYTSVTKSGFLTGLYVVLVPFIMYFVLRRKQSKYIWFCAFGALIGIYLLNHSPVDRLNFGDFLTVISAIMWAIHVILIGSLSRKFNAPFFFAFMQFFITGLLGVTAYGLFAGASFEMVANLDGLSGAMVELLYTAIMAGAIAFSLQIIGQRHTTEANAAVLLSSEALFAALFSILLISESLSFVGYIGCAILFISVVLVQLLPTSKEIKNTT